MSLYDNEIYRGPPESVPTLAKDTLSYGAEFYILKPPETTAQQDVPATEETALQQSKPTAKKKSRIAKAMKLLASCAATVAVAATLAAPAPELPLWSQISPSTYSYTYDWISQNSVDCQVATYHKSYRLTAQQEGVYLHWERGFYNYFNVDMKMLAEGWDMYLYFDTDPASIEDRKTEYSGMYSEEDQPAFGTGQIQTLSGETLYVLGMLWNGQTEEELPPAQQIIDNLDAYIQISDATADGWDKVLIGDTMYLEIDPCWTGTIGSKREENHGWFELEAVRSTADAAYSADDLICQRRVNGIDWSFYYGDSYHIQEYSTRVIWAVPGQEDLALGYDYIVGGDTLQWQEDWYSIKEWPSWVIEAYNGKLPETWQEKLVDIVDDVIIEYILCNYYLVEQMPEHKPADNPTDATEVPSTEAITEATTEATEVPLPTEGVPETLSQCEASGHTWVDANYQSPKTCSVCGETEGEALRADFETHGLPINITQLGTEYDYLTSCAEDMNFKTWGKLSITNYRVFDGDAEHPALEGYEWHSVSVKIRFGDNNALDMGMSFNECIENYYDIEGWDASGTYLEEENMVRYTCNVNGTDFAQCLYHCINTTWSGWIMNPETNIYECSVTFDQYVRLPVGYDGVVLGYYDNGIQWGEGQHIYDIADGNTLFFRLDGTGAQ